MSLLAGQSSSIKNEQIFLFQLYFHNNLDIDKNDDNLDVGDVENTTKNSYDIFNDTIDVDVPDPAIVNSKNKEKIQGSRTGQVRMMVELQLIELNKMADEYS